MTLLDPTGRPIPGSSAQPVITIVLEGRTLNFGANTIVLNKLPLESRKKILEILTRLLLQTAALFVLFFLSGCAARQAPHAEAPGQRFWHDCQEVTPANPDGFQHFVCTDFQKRQWEVFVRREGK